jgi:ribonuclease D
LLDTYRYNNKAEDAWKKIRFFDKSEYFTLKIKKIAAFRENCAMELNIPRKHFITDSQLIMICNMLPTDNASLKQIKYLKKGLKLAEIKQRLFELCKALTMELVD